MQWNYEGDHEEGGVAPTKPHPPYHCLGKLWWLLKP
jgi:hypothetical protein